MEMNSLGRTRSKSMDSPVDETKKTKLNEKKDACWYYGFGSAAIAIGGGALMIMAGPLGMAAGRIIASAGITAEVATIKQALNSSEKFDHKEVLI